MNANLFSFSVALAALVCAPAAQAVSYAVEKDVLYYDEARLAAEGDYARAKCRLDAIWPKGVTNFATVVNIHGGGLVVGNKHFADWPGVHDDCIARIAVGYRLITNATPAQCIGDTAAAIAWTFDAVRRNGGDPKKIFVTGISGGGYLSAMLAMDPKWLGAFGLKPTDLAGVAPLTGQVTKHFNVRAVGFKDNEPRNAPKVDEWAPLFWAKEKQFPPMWFMTGGRRDNEIPCRVEENEFLVASLLGCGHKNVRFVETEGSHGGGVVPSRYHLRDFVMSTCEAGGVSRFLPGERVVFLGDSITHGAHYVAFLQLYQSLRHPGSGVRILNAGIGGDSAGGGLARLGWDVAPMKPDRVFVLFGMNDVGRDLYASAAPSESVLAARARALDSYDANVRKLADALAARHVKTVLMTPSPYNSYSAAPTNANLVCCNEPGLADCAARVRRFAAERWYGLVDLHAPLTAIAKKHPEKTFCGDRVHPGVLGHVMMGAEILRAMHVDPVVAQVSIDAAAPCVWPRANAKRKGETQNAVVSALVKRADGIAFTYAPKALPLPARDELRELERYEPFAAHFNRERFFVENLPEGTYALAFDGVEVGAFTAAEFAKGVDVAALATPNQKRACEAGDLARKLAGLQGTRRTLALTDRRVYDAKIDPADEKKADAYLASWVVQMKASKNRYADYYAKVTAGYAALRARRAALAAEEEDLYARLDAMRPAVSRVTISRKAK